MTTTPAVRRPTAEIVPAGPDDQLAAMTVEELRSELGRHLEVTASHLVRLARIVAELESRGEDLSDLRLGIVGYLRRIASGQLLPELVVRYQGYPLLLQRAAQLPLADQRRLADGEGVTLAVPRAEGGYTNRRFDPLHLTRDQIALVFGANGLRSEPEQIAVLESRASRPARVSPQATAGRVTADRATMTVRVGRAKAPVADVVAALADLKRMAEGGRDDGARDVPVTAKLTEGEHRRLQLAGIDSGRTMNDLVRDALAAAGLI
jgi:hypothetical protein